MRIIILSLFKVIVVAILIAVPLWSFFSIPFLNSFITAIILQLITGYIYNTYLDNKYQKDIQLKQLDIKTYIEETAAEAACAHCNTVNLIPITPGSDNDFECIECGKENAVYINITVAQKTDMVNIPQYEISKFDNSFEKAKESLQQNEQREQRT